jgi:hypothetical protein
MFPQLFQLAGAQTPSLLVFIDLSLATLTGASRARILRRERRRLRRCEVARLRQVGTALHLEKISRP